MLTIAILMTVFLLVLLCLTFMMLIDTLLGSMAPFPVPLIVLIMTVGAYVFCISGTWLMYARIGH